MADEGRRRTNLLTVGIPFILFGLGMGTIGAWGLFEVWRFLDWVPVEGQVLEATSGRFDYDRARAHRGSYEGVGTRVQVRYAWEVDGVRYEGDRYAHLEPWDEYLGDDHAVEAAARLRELDDGTLDLFYDPDAPDEAVIALPERVPPFVLSVVGAGLLFAGLVLVGRAAVTSGR